MDTSKDRVAAHRAAKLAEDPDAYRAAQAQQQAERRRRLRVSALAAMVADIIQRSAAGASPEEVAAELEARGAKPPKA
jgi:hypothetical protein